MLYDVALVGTGLLDAMCHHDSDEMVFIDPS